MALPLTQFPNLRPKTYDELRAEVRSGDILLCQGSGIFSQMIQKVSNSVWSHVAFIMRLDEIDRIMVLESVEPIGVRTVPLSHYVRDYKDHKGYPGKLLIARHDDFVSVTEKKLNQMAAFAIDRFGYPYDKDEIAKIAARITLGLFGRKKGKASWDDEYICSEYAWECYRSVGIDVPYDPRGFIAPKDFAAVAGVKAVAAVKVEK
jgi:hypothetical protein